MGPGFRVPFHSSLGQLTRPHHGVYQLKMCFMSKWCSITAWKRKQRITAYLSRVLIGYNSNGFSLKTGRRCTLILATSDTQVSGAYILPTNATLIERQHQQMSNEKRGQS